MMSGGEGDKIGKESSQNYNVLEQNLENAQVQAQPEADQQIDSNVQQNQEKDA